MLSKAKKSYNEFNASDALIGDGDLGITILNGLEEINNNISNFKDDLGHNFMFCSQSFVKKSGSSFGTLIAFAFMNISKNLKSKISCNHDDIVNILGYIQKGPPEISEDISVLSQDQDTSSSTTLLYLILVIILVLSNTA